MCSPHSTVVLCFFFFFNDPATPEIYPLSLHDALPIYRAMGGAGGAPARIVTAGKADAETERRARVEVRIHRDRKSTRLNSSHTVISYAVFCLKKKTNKYKLSAPYSIN